MQDSGSFESSRDAAVQVAVGVRQGTDLVHRRRGAIAPVMGSARFAAAYCQAATGAGRAGRTREGVHASGSPGSEKDFSDGDTDNLPQPSRHFIA